LLLPCLDPEDGDSTVLRNVGKLLLDDRHHIPEDVILHSHRFYYDSVSLFYYI
jgi:hypothetical protein